MRFGAEDSIGLEAGSKPELLIALAQLDTPGALAALWEMAKDRSLSGADVRAGILDADRVFGLRLGESDEQAVALCQKMFGVFIKTEDLPSRVKTLVDSREAARSEERWAEADKLRTELQKMGYAVEDTSRGPRVFRKD